ncbi:hypothetical protein DFJ73DRAFT_628873 [Zopfochytrium polystomum]|nr:hypothetical protein DFJ73DRAFT_628873 [Zopfochytrium polystomum]
MPIQQLPQEEITTIFVVGFPEDIQEREFQNMFTFASGFEAATLKFPANFDADDGVPQYKKQIIGFAKFRTRLEALQARDHLSGRKVDAERGCILKAEIAKKNLHTKRGISNDYNALHAASQSFQPMNAMISNPLNANTNLNMINLNNNHNNPPCNTLYVGNLPPNTNENELRELFSKCPGYKRLSFRTRPNGPMCFVEFEDVQYAQVALNELHGSPLSNSIKGGIRLSFSKNPLGVRQPSNTPTPQPSVMGQPQSSQQQQQQSQQQLNLMNGFDKDSSRLVFSF